MTPTSNRSDPESVKRGTRAALGSVLIALSLGIVILSVYSARTGAVAWLGLQLLVMAAAVALGILLGFLFGIPRMLQAPEERAPVSETEQNRRSRKLLSYQSNTNLEQISDWLTKILVGVGLTQVHKVGGVLREISAYLAGPTPAPGAVSATSASIVYFLITGFFLGYLWTRLVYARLLVSTESTILQELAEAEDDRDTLSAIAISAATRGVGKQTGPDETIAAGEEAMAQAPQGLDVDLPPIQVHDDPNKGRFGGAAARNGLKLTAIVKALPTDADWFTVVLEVKAAPTRKLTEPVIFYLHPSFNEPIETVMPVANVARLELLSYGAFTVGVIADNGKTLLELDLAQMSNAPKTFRER